MGAFSAAGPQWHWIIQVAKQYLCCGTLTNKNTLVKFIYQTPLERFQPEHKSVSSY